jgi:hypothetical protein
MGIQKIIFVGGSVLQRRINHHFGVFLNGHAN